MQSLVLLHVGQTNERSAADMRSDHKIFAPRKIIQGRLAHGYIAQ